MLAAASLELKAEKKNAHGADQYGNTGVLSVGYSPDGAKVVSSGYDGTLKVWDAGRLTPPAPHRSHDPLWTRARSRQKRTCPSPSPHPDTLQLVEERKGDGSALDASGSGAVAERDGATLRLKEGGGVFYAPGPLQSVAVHWPRLVAGAQSGALYHLEVQG